MSDTPEALRGFELMARAAHDLRNQIAVVSTAASLLQRSWDALGEDLRREQVDVIAEHSERLRALTDAVLDWASIETGRMSMSVVRIDLADAVEAAVREAAPGHPVEVQVAHEAVMADPRHLGRILGNLIGNAVKYGSPPIHVSSARAGDELVIHVEDYGSGVPEHLRDRMFEPFARHARAGEQSTGLGLAIVKGLVELQRGRVWYERVERVCRFSVALPAAD